MLAGLVVTVVVSAAGLRAWQAAGIALGNAVGISVAAMLLLIGVRRRVVNIAMRSFLAVTGQTVLAGAAAGIVAWPLAHVLRDNLPTLVVALLGGLVLVAVYAVAIWLLRVPEARAAVATVGARLRG
jgi:putative peptidoglycan lipid II flippase